MRIGTKHRPFYRIVAVDERRKRTGGYLDLIGTYNPLTTPKDIKIDQTKLEEWKKKGAVLSHGFLRILGNAPQKPARKPKKTKEEKVEKVTPKEVAPAEETAQPEEAPVEEVAETPADEPTPEVAEEEKA